jgi:two-component system, OmpR family, sensor kinase
MSGPGIRRRLFYAVVATVACAVAALVVGFNLILGHTLDRDARDLARTRATAQLGFLETRNGRLVVREAPDDASADAYVWVFSGGRTIERPRTGRAVDAVARSLVGGRARFADVPPADIRLYATPAVVNRRHVGTVVAGVSLAAYEQTARLALIGSLAFGAIVLGLVTLAARWLLGSALRPVRRMTRQAAAWSEHDLDHRFGLGEPTDELTELAATLDGLLDRLAASLRREQRFSAELSHELRTPLARVRAESELALRRDRTPEEYREALEQINRNAAQLTRTVDVLLAAARHEAGFERGTADAYELASEAAAGCADLAARRSLALRVEPPAHPIRVGVDRELGERILQPVLDNACRHGARAVDITIERRNGAVRFTVADDGPGVAARDRDRIFEPGVRAANGPAGTGAGLGLALARRLARSVSGEVSALEDRRGGGRFVIMLPQG